MLEFLIGEAGEEIKKVYRLMERAKATRSLGEVAECMQEAYGVMRNSRWKGQLYGEKPEEAVQEVIAGKFLEEIELTKKDEEVGNDLERVIFTYQEIFNGLIDDNREMRQRCLGKVSQERYKRVGEIIGRLDRGQFDREWIETYERLREGIERKEGGKLGITIKGAKGETSKPADEVFYGLMTKNMIRYLNLGRFELKRIGQCEAMRKDYYYLRDKYEKAKGELPCLQEEGNEILTEEIFCFQLAGYLERIGGQNPAQAGEIKKYRDRVIGETQDFLNEKVREAGEEGKRDKFERVARAFVRFTKNYVEILEETKEEAEEAMKGLRKKYFGI